MSRWSTSSCRRPAKEGEFTEVSVETKPADGIWTRSKLSSMLDLITKPNNQTCYSSLLLHWTLLDIIKTCNKLEFSCCGVAGEQSKRAECLALKEKFIFIVTSDYIRADGESDQIRAWWSDESVVSAQNPECYLIHLTTSPTGLKQNENDLRTFGIKTIDTESPVK